MPLVTVSTLYFLIQHAVPQINWEHSWHEIWQIYFMPYAHFWFLQALILVLAVVGILDRFGMMDKFSGYLLVFVTAIFLPLFIEINPSVFSSDQALYLLPFFLAGLGAYRFSAQFQWPPFKYLCIAVFVVLMTLHALAVFYLYGQVADRKTLSALILSLSGLMTLFYTLPSSRLLSWIGDFSFTIYLYHVFFTAGTRIALHAMGFSNLLINFFLGSFFGITGPIALDFLLKKNTLLKSYFLGEFPKK